MVYLDFFIAGDTITGNVFYQGGPRAALLLNGAIDSTVTNNIFVEVGAPVEYTSPGLTWCRGILLSMLSNFKAGSVDPMSPPWSTRFPEMTRYQFSDDWMAVPKGNLFANNIMYQTKNIKRNYAPPVPTSAVEEENNLILNHDPFIKINDLDFRLRDEQAIEARLPEFEPIPVQKIGLYADEHRS